MMTKEVLRDRVSVTIRRTSLFRLVESILEDRVIEDMIDHIIEHLSNGLYSRDTSIDYISGYLEARLSEEGVDLDDDVDGIALAILFVYEELIEDKSEFFDQIKGKSAPVIPINDSDGE